MPLIINYNNQEVKWTVLDTSGDTVMSSGTPPRTAVTPVHALLKPWWS